MEAAGGRHEGLVAEHVKRRAHKEGGVLAFSKHVLFFPPHVFVTSSPEESY